MATVWGGSGGVNGRGEGAVEPRGGGGGGNGQGWSLFEWLRRLVDGGHLATLGRVELALLLVAARRADGGTRGGRFFGSMANLVRLTTTGPSDRRVREAIRRLESRGLLRRVDRRPLAGGRGWVPVYEVPYPPACVAVEAPTPSPGEEGTDRPGDALTAGPGSPLTEGRGRTTQGTAQGTPPVPVGRGEGEREVRRLSKRDRAVERVEAYLASKAPQAQHPEADPAAGLRKLAGLFCGVADATADELDLWADRFARCPLAVVERVLGEMRAGSTSQYPELAVFARRATLAATPRPTVDRVLTEQDVKRQERERLRGDAERERAELIAWSAGLSDDEREALRQAVISESAGTDDALRAVWLRMDPLQSVPLLQLMRRRSPACVASACR